jgi:serine/threonine protein phosphatase PrpC
MDGLSWVSTTLTALLWSGSQLGLVHIGDSRAYLVRDGEVFQITQDHTLVQSLLDEGKITADEVASHPQRLLLLRALDGDHSSRPDLQLRQAQAGDRYLLCSDGLHVVVPRTPSPGSCSPWPTLTRPPGTCSPWPWTAAPRTTSPASSPTSNS